MPLFAFLTPLLSANEIVKNLIWVHFWVQMRNRPRDRAQRIANKKPGVPPLCPARCPPQSVAACLSIVAGRILSRMGTKSRETIYGASVRAAAERATEARKEADRLACEAWNKRMLGFQGPAQPSPALGDALNAGYRYLEVKCRADRRQRRFTNWNDTCDARTAVLKVLPAPRDKA
jgi:hypothetical protein